MGNIETRWFRGGQEGFIGGHYAIWYNGLAKQPANLVARKVGIRNAYSILSQKSTHKNASYRKLIDYLKQIQQKEEDKEIRLLTNELGKTSSEFVDDNLRAQVQRAISEGEFGIAYTLILRRAETLKSIQEEMKKSEFQSPQKMRSFWDAQFFTYLSKRLSEGLEQKDGVLVKQLKNGSLTIEEVVDDWINEMIMGKNGVSIESLNFISEQAKNKMVTFFTEAGISNINRNSNLFDIDYKTVSQHKSVKRISQRNRKSGKWGSTKKTKIDDITEGFVQGFFRGLSTEIMAIAEQNSKGTATFGTGDLTKNIYNELLKKGYNVQQKADVVSVLAYSEDIYLQERVEDLYNAYAEGAVDKVEYLRQRLEASGRELEDLFVIETNVKGYTSYSDLSIEGEGSFGLRANNLVKMRNILPAKMADRLVFLLVNTVQGCIASHKQDLEVLKQYIAATMAAWMWDDYDQLFDINEQTDIKRVRMFKSGSMYYSASQILAQGISDLEKNLKEEEKNSFINVHITPPTFNADSTYKKLLEMPEMQLSEGGDNELILEKRWNYMRDIIMNRGKLSIDISQQQLDRLLGDLKGYLEN